jgi:hypothetical protein
LSQESINVTHKVINPGALSLGRLLGEFEESGEWADGNFLMLVLAIKTYKERVN